MAEAANLTGAQRAAIFLLGLGENGAASVMRHMEPKEVQRVGEAMTSLPEIDDGQIENVIQEFSDSVAKISPISIGTGAFTRRVMVQALGENKARNVLSQVMKGEGARGVDALKWMDARSVAGLIRDEHPQIITIVLASLDGDHAAQVLELLPEDIRKESIRRIARLELIDPTAMEELDQVLEIQLRKSDTLPPTPINGPNTAANILNNLNANVESTLMDDLNEQDQELAEKVRDLMFVFENLLAVDDRGMQRIVREISVDSLVIALKGVSAAVQDKFFNNMSSRAADMLKEDIEAKGPVKLSEVEKAQKAILSVALRLADEGEISLGRGDDDFV